MQVNDFTEVIRYHKFLVFSVLLTILYSACKDPVPLQALSDLEKSETNGKGNPPEGYDPPEDSTGASGNQDSTGISMPDAGYPGPGVFTYYDNFEVDIWPTPRNIRQHPPPNTPYGQFASIDFRINDDNTLDVLWRDRFSPRYFLSRISLETQSLVTHIAMPLEVTSTGSLVSFDKMGKDRFVVGYSKNNEFGDRFAEQWYTAFDISGKKIFSTRILGEKTFLDNEKPPYTEYDNDPMNCKVSNSPDCKYDNDRSLGGPESQGTAGSLLAGSYTAGSATVRYDPNNNSICVYFSISIHVDPPVNGAPANARHQSSWLGYLDASTGVIKRGARQFVNHDFDQRLLLSSSGRMYSLSHGDASPRGLVFATWEDRFQGNNFWFTSFLEYQNLGIWDYNTNYNVTNAITGDFAELPNGDVALVYAIGQGRPRWDLRLIFITDVATSNRQSPPRVRKQVWITENTDSYVGWGAKVAVYGPNHILVAWNNTNSNNAMYSSSFALFDATSGQMVRNSLKETSDVSLYPAQSIRPTPNGSHLVWVSKGSGSTLRVHRLEIKDNPVFEEVVQ